MNNNLPLVSIITPSFNQMRFLEATIRSVLEQDYPRIEYLVIDGASSDGSVDLIRKYSNRLAYWESQPDHGQAHAINKGIIRSSGDFLGWINSDDILLPHTVRSVVEIFRRNPDVDVVYGHLERIDETGNLIPTPKLPKDQLVFSQKHILGECIVNQPGSFWRRASMEKVGLLDESLRYALDYDYWIRFALNGAKFKRIDKTVAHFRISRKSKTVAETAAHAYETLKVLGLYESFPGLETVCQMTESELRYQARKTRARMHLQAFYGEIKQGNSSRALHQLLSALKNDPGSILERRWLALGLASIQRRLPKRY